VFECLQLKRLAAGEITEAMALERIQTTLGLVGQVNGLLQEAGKTNLKRPLFKRFEKAVAEPPTPSLDSEAGMLHGRLRQAMEELNSVLNADFRIIPSNRAVVAEGDEALANMER
jgi:hypothetical protein